MLTFKNGPPVDRGWAWLVVFAAFMHLFILIGLAKSSGIIFVELIEKYNGSASSASLMVALQTGISLFSAPLITAAVEMFTCRSVCYAGSILFASAFFIASFLDSLEKIAITFGILAGFGYGCCLTPTPVIVGRYFDKKRSKANGLAFSGTGLGNVVMPVLVYHLIDRYYLHGALLILAAFSLQTSVFASLYRPLSLYKSVHSICPQSREKFDDQAVQIFSENNVANSGDTQLNNSLNFVKNKESSVDSPHEENLNGDLVENIPLNDRKSPHQSILDLTLISSLHDIPRSLAQLDMPQNDKAALGNERKVRQTWRGAMQNFVIKICYTKSDNGQLKHILSIELLKNREYLFSMLGVIFFLNAFFMSMVVPPHCADLNFSKADAAMMLSIQGGADMCGRLFTAFIGDQPFFRTRRRMALCIYSLLVACIIVVLPALRSFYAFSLALICCSFVFGAFVALNPVVVTDIVGIDRLAGAWGLQLFFEGFTLTVSPLVVGALRDSTGSYDACFWYIGGSCALATICIAISTFWFATKKS